MNTYNGIPIHEYRILALVIISAVMLLGLAVVFGFFVRSCVPLNIRKKRQNIKSLKERAESDELAKRKLEKIMRKKARKRKREKGNIIFNVVLWSLSACLAVALIVFFIVPGVIDYVKKDYIVYTGEITVYRTMKNSHINLDDGTTVWGNCGFDGEDTYGTVVYSKRTKQVLGGRK